jgi:hypothetical protein
MNKGTQKTKHFVGLFPKGKKAMEMWQIVMIILAVMLLLFFITWYGVLGGKLGGFFKKLGDLF